MTMRQSLANPSAEPMASAAAEPCISVVVTTYNGAHHLPEQIDSILRQTCAAFDLIISDDHSDAATPPPLRAYAERDGRVRLLFNDTNLGLHRNLEQALRQVRGQFVAISDQDDVWAPHKLARLLQGIGAHAAAYSDSLLIDTDGQSLGVTLLQRLRLKHPETDSHA